MEFKYNDYQLIKKLHEITNHIEHYKTDFTDYDFPKIMELLHENEIADYLWIIRNTGTFLLKKPDKNDFPENKKFNDLYYCIADNWKSRIEYTLKFNNGYISISEPEIYC